uniref:LIM zinc-binding domain-containing protein n=1 Tax=Monopterus albus TaxID=43700 RepID=A0A3Q3K4A1_MONAL
MDQRAVCAGCHRPIRDRFLLRVTDCLWHEECVRCASCDCRWKGLFAVHCGGCAEPISPAELVMHAGAAVFHLRCFVCSVCSCRLQTGDCCVLREGQLLCTTKGLKSGRMPRVTWRYEASLYGVSPCPNPELSPGPISYFPL